MQLAIDTRHRGANAKIWHGDALRVLENIKPNSVSLIASSPPYFMGKEYDKSESPEDFIAQHRLLFPKLIKVLKPGGSICWQVGHHVRNNVAIPLDALVYGVTSNLPELVLRNRLVWTFNHGTHSAKRFSGRHETILWYTKGNDYKFNLDAVRIPQIYPGKKHYKGPNKGNWSGNPLGKNPGDVWDIPNVKAKHVEKTDHPCQFPMALVGRLIKSLTDIGDIVLDPFLGSGTTGAVALIEQRHFIGCELNKKYITIIRRRIQEIKSGGTKMRPDTPTKPPIRSQAVAKTPSHFSVNPEA